MIYNFLDLYLCSQIISFENNMETYYGFFKIWAQFSESICNQLVQQALKDIEIIDSNYDYGEKAYGYIRKSSLYFLLSVIMLNIKHDCHGQCLEFVLEKIQNSSDVKYPVQKTYVTWCLMLVRNCIKNCEPKGLKLKNKVFTEIFTLLSHKYDSVNKAALLSIELIKGQEKCETISEIISSRHGVFWSNIFSHIKYLDLMEKNTTKISLIFRSLKAYGFNNFKENLDDVIIYLGQAIDHFLDINDWNSLMIIFELVNITSQLIHDHLSEKDKAFANCVKNMILIVKQFFTATKSK